MTQMIADSYRGLSLAIVVALEVLLMPAAIAVALTGAAMIGLQLIDLLAPMPHRL
ncbi:hypothetical protein [Pontitalea aquivivens]|uniref:hypothetical protein n=1 Tax=Pontitalea aquivivens TaxID=3388663 RepID=UPI003970D29F